MAVTNSGPPYSPSTWILFYRVIGFSINATIAWWVINYTHVWLAIKILFGVESAIGILIAIYSAARVIFRLVRHEDL